MDLQNIGVGMDKKSVTTENGSRLIICRFDNFQDLEKYWIESFDSFKENKIRTKVIGTSLIIFEKEK